MSERQKWSMHRLGFLIDEGLIIDQTRVATLLSRGETVSDGEDVLAMTTTGLLRETQIDGLGKGITTP